MQLYHLGPTAVAFLCVFDHFNRLERAWETRAETNRKFLPDKRLPASQPVLRHGPDKRARYSGPRICRALPCITRGKKLRTFISVCLFEGGLGVVAWAFGWLSGYSPLTTIEFTWISLAWGVLGTLPLIVLLLLLERPRWTALVEIRRVVQELLVPLFHQFSVWQLFWVALLAGVGEELFFRGFVQGGLAIFFTHLNVPSASLTALFLASVLFGVMHPITRTYAVLCMLAGLYLGGLWLWTDNLLVPILVHAIYDFFALFYLLRSSHRNVIRNPDDAAAEA